MKSFTNLKTIDDIMHIVDGIKGYGGLGYKPYFMEGGTITNKKKASILIDKLKNEGNIEGLSKVERGIDRTKTKIETGEIDYIDNEEEKENDIFKLQLLKWEVEGAKTDVETKKKEEKQKQKDEENRQRRDVLKEQPKRIIKTTKKYDKKPNIQVEKPKEISNYKTEFIHNKAKLLKNKNDQIIYDLSYNKAKDKEGEGEDKAKSLALGDAVEAFVQDTKMQVFLSLHNNDETPLLNTKEGQTINEKGEIINQTYYTDKFLNIKKNRDNLQFFPIDYIKKYTYWEIKNRYEYFDIPNNNLEAMQYKDYFIMQKTKYKGIVGKFLFSFNKDKKLRYKNKQLNIQACEGKDKYMECFKDPIYKDYYSLLFFKDKVIIYDITKDVNFNSVNIGGEIKEGWIVGDEEYGNFTELFNGYKVPKFNKDGTMRDCFKEINLEDIRFVLNN